MADAARTLLDGADPGPLFTGFRLGNLDLTNRFVMAPMTRQCSPNGVPGDDVAEYYARRAGHIGLLITEGTLIDHPSAGSSDRVPRLYGTEPLAGWSRVIEAVHAAGGRIAAQLWHVGMTRRPGSAPFPDAPVMSPSGIDANGETVGDPATKADLEAVIASYARAAGNAQKVGFDGVELHGAHGYLLDQFLWPRTNRRADTYGGSVANRSRLPAEVIAAVRAEVGPGFPVTIRLSQWKIGHYDARLVDTAGELEQLLTPLVSAGLTAVHASARRYWQAAFEESDLTFAGWIRKLTDLPTIAVGSVGVSRPFLAGEADATAESLSLAPLLERFVSGEFDLVAAGRAVLSDPSWTSKLRDGRLSEITVYQKGDEARLY
jgi:2,4-dienoyl-CoA reductase-like NADH-dependent reductase (Old Yellow Enzyme family)